MEELIVELLLVENVWCQKQSWSFMNLLCSGMVGFGLRRNLGTTEKEHPSPTLPPPKVGEVLLFYISQTASRWFLSLSLMKSASTFPTIGDGGGRGGEGCSFSAVPKFRRRPKPTIPLHSKFINNQLFFWHHTFSKNSSSTISSSILSTTRRGELYGSDEGIVHIRFNNLHEPSHLSNITDQASKYFVNTQEVRIQKCSLPLSSSTFASCRQFNNLYKLWTAYTTFST